MDTIRAIRNGEIELPIPTQMMFGGCPVDPSLIEICEPLPRWDERIDDLLDARISSL
ncbi:MAG: hypothetical protein ACRDKJ_05000 [Actinomycetota bacterium]